jgi:hypothetical protein
MELQKQTQQVASAGQAAQLDMGGTQKAAEGVRQTARSVMPLMDRLSQFSGKALEQGTKKMIEAAKEEAVTDLVSGDFKEFGLKNDMSIYGMAYDSAAKTAYISQASTDIQADAKLLAAENKYNPEGFRRLWDKRIAQISESSNKISPYVAAVVTDMADQYGAAAYTQIASNLATIQYNAMVKSNKEALALYENEFVSAKISGNEEVARTALINRNKVLQSMKNNYQITEIGIETANKLFEKSVIVSQVKANYATAQTMGEGADFIIGFRSMVKDDPAFEKFTPSEIDAIETSLYESISKKNAFENQRLSAEKAQRERLQLEVTDAFDQAWVAGVLTIDEVDAALEANAITPALHKHYAEKVYDTGDPFTNTGVELAVTANYKSFTVQDIIDMKGMTNKDKMRHIKSLRSYQASDGGKWTSTVQGRAALNMLKNRFNIVEANMLADLTKEEDIQNYGKLYENFIFEMEKLPPELRESHAMHYARAAIDSQDAALIESQGSVSEKINETERKAIEENVKAYQRRIGKAKSEIYYKGLVEFSDNFGHTGDVNFEKIEDWR